MSKFILYKKKIKRNYDKTHTTEVKIILIKIKIISLYYLSDRLPFWWIIIMANSTND